MVLKENRGGREYDKFVADGSGDTSLRVTSTSSITTSATSSGASTTAPSSGGVSTASSGGTILIGKGSAADANVDVSGKNRIGIQIYNTGGQSATYKVYGNLVSGSTGDVNATNYTQIGDDITVASGATAYRAISTTPIYNIGVHGTAASSTTTTNVYIMAD